MSYSIDANILIYASDGASPHQNKALQFLKERENDPDLMCLTWLTLMSYQRIATHPGIFLISLTPEEAWQNIQALLNFPRVRVIGEESDFGTHYFNRPLSKLAYADEVQGVDGAEKLSVQELLDASSTGATKHFAAEVGFGKKSNLTSSFPVRGNLVPDAHLATILRQHGVEKIYSADRDFRKFEFIKVINPL